MPVLSDPPQDRLTGRATTLLSFNEQLHATANYGGFSAARNKLMESLGEYIDQYVDETIDQIRTGEVENIENAEAYLGVAARLSQLLRGGKAGELVRRRAQSALHPDQPGRSEEWPLR